jgi:hypothetical protein
MIESEPVTATRASQEIHDRTKYDDSPVIDYHKSKASYLREYEIQLRFLSRGMIIRVGCKEIPFTTIEEGMEALNNYIDSPPVEGKKWAAILD